MSAVYDKSRLPPFSLLDEPSLSFGPGDKHIDVNPLRGLANFGPYNQSSFPKYTPELRIATIGPVSGRPRIADLVRTLRSNHVPSDRKDYVPSFPGFEKLFGVPLVAAKAGCHLEWPERLEDLHSQGSPEERLKAAFGSALNQLLAVRDRFDVVTVHLPDSWGQHLRTQTFDAHDSLKCLGAQLGIPTQVINDRTFSFKLKASLAWRLSIALFSKAGGIPWKLAPLAGVPEGTAYIGLAYALRGDPTAAQFVTCCSQVFDADGGGMQFVAFEARDPVTDPIAARKNPFLSRSDMRAVLARSLLLYQARSAGMLPRRLVIHKTTSFKPQELEGVFDALSAVPEVECIEVSASPGWRGVWLKQSRAQGKTSEPDGYPVPRGTVLQRTEASALVWVAGNAPGASLGSNYYQGKKSIPMPLNLVRHAGSGPLELSALEALALTKMDWNNDALYDALPVTVQYSQRLARTIANVSDLPGNAYPYRLFM